MIRNIFGKLATCRQAIRSLAIAACLFAAIPSRAEESNSGKEPSAGDNALFERLDANHDGTIAAAEVPKEGRSLFDRLIRRGDANRDGALSRGEFVTSLVPTRPAKRLDEKEPATLPEANAVRYMLLTMDANRDTRIEIDEVPQELKEAADTMIERMDRNGNGALERQELSRGGPAMSAVAGRYAAKLGVDVDAELKRLKKSQGEDVYRFEEQPMPLAEIRDPKQAKRLFGQLDDNGDRKLDPREVPEPLREAIGRMTRLADRDGDGKLSQEEFTTASERLSRLVRRGTPPDVTPQRDRKTERKMDRDNQ